MFSLILLTDPQREGESNTVERGRWRPKDSRINPHETWAWAGR